MKQTLAYLASPYSDTDPAVQHRRYLDACDAAAALMARGRMVLSPIAHTHPIARRGALPTGFDFWQRFDRRLIAACDELWVLRIDGWRESVGVRAEIAIARELGKPVRLVYPRRPCERCGEVYAASSRGLWKHVCAQRLPEMQPERVEAVA